ncbi:MAG: secretin and TonB N-terminal domain-containing protein, partial [Deltaproteobacteria bacterium]|nr:secretin and TonB N-terminal domain-containing protein [Deltaproteobacteria bacterium]
MGKIGEPNKRGFVSCICVTICFLIIAGCATPAAKQKANQESLPPVIEAMNLTSMDGKVIIEIVNNRPAHYTAFKLIDPPRIILDIRGVPGENLPLDTDVNRNRIQDIRFEKGKTQAMTTRMIIETAGPLDYVTETADHIIRLTISPEQPTARISEPVPQEKPTPKKAASEDQAAPSAPRIFVKPKPSGINQVLGIDFTMLDRGRSRVIVTLDHKGPYDLQRKGPKTLLLKLPQTTIPPQILRGIDSSQFKGAVSRITPSFTAAEKQVQVTIDLKEMVPFHMKQTDKDVRIDFGRTSVKSPKRKIVPIQLTKPSAPAATPAQTPAPAAPQPGTPQPPGGLTGFMGSRYTGAPMTMDFVNADITNILRLIGEISNLNIIWGPEVRGTVSMRLKNVPWDQALDLILTNNNLAKRQVGNVIWVTTRAKMSKIEADEKRKKDEIQRQIQAQIKAEQTVAKQEELGTAYITINYKDPNNIKKILNDTVKSKQGRMTVDTQTKTIILFDRLSKLEEAKALVKRLDQPTPQVMIEARIVEASTSFSRSLGIQWNYELQNRSREEVSWNGAPAWAPNNVETDYPPGGAVYAPTFSTGFGGTVFPGRTIGLAFTKLNAWNLTGQFLDAQLALAEANGESKILSAPKILTRDTVQASIQQGTKLTLPSGTDANGNKTFQLVDASLKLDVTPQITPN